MKSKSYFLYAAICLIWGTTWVILKKSLIEGTPAIYGVGLRFFAAGIILLLISFFQKRSIPRSREAINIYISFGLLNLVIGYGATYWATQYIYSNLASILWTGFPIIIVIMSHFYLPNEKINLPKIISLAIGAAGVLLILSQGKAFGGENVIVGMSVIIVAVILAAWPNVYLKKHNHAIDTLTMNAVCQTGAGIILLTISSFLEKDQVMIWSPFNIFAMVYLTLFGSIAAWLIYVWLFKHLTMTQIAYVAFPPPVIASFLGWTFLGEALTPIAILGAMLVITGAVAVNLKH
jgi:drug/metabolite transporter (DMT)-like permease